MVSSAVVADLSIPPTAPVLRTWLDRWNTHDLDGLRDLADPGYVHHAMNGADLDLEGFLAGFRAVLGAFPDVAYRVEHVLTDGDLAAAFLVATATHGGSYLGIEPTGRRVEIRGAYHCRVRDGRIVEDWDVFDLLTPAFGLGAVVGPRSDAPPAGA